MTERSVQIWFQNRFVTLLPSGSKAADHRSRRRAKIKVMAKKSLEAGEDCDAIPESYRNYLAMQAMESGKPLARGLLGHSSLPMGSYGHGMFLGAEAHSAQKVGMLQTGIWGGRAR